LCQPDANGHTYGHGYGHTNSYAHAYGYTYGNGNSYSHADSHTHADADAHGSRFSDTYANLHTVNLAKRAAHDHCTAQSSHSGSGFQHVCHHWL